MCVEGRGYAKRSEVAWGQQRDGLEEDAGGREEEAAEKVDDAEVETEEEVP